MIKHLRNSVYLSAIVLLSISLQGCVIAIGNDGMGDDEDWQDRQEHNLQYINQLRLNISSSEILDELGDPDFKESFQRDGELFEILYFRTEHLDSDGMTSKAETTPLVFIDKQLVGWGQLAIDKVSK